MNDTALPVERIEDTSHDTDIAIIGMAGRFPGARSLEEFWANLQAGVESIRVFSRAELLAAGIDAAQVDDPAYVPAHGALAEIEHFAAEFFGYTPREAAQLDPQQRLFLECAQEALETAGYGAAAYRGVVGVYAGAGPSHYHLYHLAPTFAATDFTARDYAHIGNDPDFLATRLAYKLNLQGPSINVQAACSTSLVAVHLACQGLLDGECAIALAGGVTIRLPQVAGYLYQPDMAFSPDGHVRAFDAKAQGMVDGSGVGMVVLKRYQDAHNDGDTIYAVIKGSAVNNDGAQKIGFTAPSAEGQARVITEALTIAAVDAATISYVEAHGTGTVLGDPIEIQGLTTAFRAYTKRRGFCAIGSLKTNVGHLDRAAGVAGLIKTVLALKHKLLPPSLHFTIPNPQIDFAQSPFYVNAKLAEWPPAATPRRAGVSSFGLGGTNVHVIVEEAPAAATRSPSGPARNAHLLLLSAKTATALEAATTNLVNYLRANPTANLADVAYTLQVGRAAYAHRRMVVCRDVQEALRLLGERNPRHVFQAVAAHDRRPVAFLFGGAGGAYIGMGQELYATEPVFRQTVDQSAALLLPLIQLDLRTLLYPPETALATGQLQQPLFALPAIFVTEYALAKLWMAWGVQPNAMLGHSLGEYVAAALAGVFSLEDTLRLIVKRCQLFATLSAQDAAGGMMAVSLAEAELLPLLDAECSIAAINTTDICTVAGPVAALERLAATLSAHAVDFSHLPVGGAAHSSAVDALVAPYRAFVATLVRHVPQLPFVSNLTGSWITDAQATDPNYWAQQMRQTVRFADGIATLLQEPEQILLEVSPKRVVTAFARRHPARQGQPVVASLHDPQENRAGVASLLESVGRLWLAGAEIDWAGVYAHQSRRRVALPTYPFERQRYWVEAPGQRQQGRQETVTAAIVEKEPDLADWCYLPLWKQTPPVPLSLQTPAVAVKTWLIFADDAGVSNRLAEALRQDGQRVLLVRPGLAFAVLPGTTHPPSYQVNPEQPADFMALANALRQQAQRPDIIVYAWAVTADEPAPANPTPHVDRSINHFGALLHLTQMLDAQEWTNALQVAVLVNHLYAVLGNEQLQPEKALLLGWYKTMPFEYPAVDCRLLEIGLPDHPAAQTRLSEQIRGELQQQRSREQQGEVVAYRGKQRWVQQVEPVPLPPATQELRLRKQGVYLIAGGMNGVGLTLATALAEQYQANLILVGRSPFPDHQQWPEWLLAHPTTDATSQKIRLFQALEAAGATVMIRQADVTDDVQMRAVVAEASAAFGAIHGVIHSAYTFGGGVMLRETMTAAQTVMAPKVQGTQVLDALFADAPLDFMVYCSGSVTLTGAFGHATYTAANAFQDAYAYERTRRTGQPTLSINWDRWLGIGTAQRLQAAHEALTGEKLTGMTPQEGCEVFLRLLNSHLAEYAQVLVSIQKVATLLATRFAELPGETRVLPHEPNANGLELHARPNLNTAYVAPTTPTEELLAGLYQKLFGIAAVGIYDNFFDLGGHSLLGTRLIAQIRKHFQIELPLRTLFEEPTIAGLAERIATVQLVQKLQQHDARLDPQPSNTANGHIAQKLETGRI
ncbi:MAG: beta-ketoacyl synthase N-terminal-like domain-containing protein [Caldilineaceae bacterium]